MLHVTNVKGKKKMVACLNCGFVMVIVNVGCVFYYNLYLYFAENQVSLVENLRYLLRRDL